MKGKELYDEVVALKEATRIAKVKDVQTKYKTIALYNDILKALRKDVATKPTKISKDGKHYTCPTCKTNFESTEGTYDDYTCCYICGQKFRELREGELG